MIHNIYEDTREEGGSVCKRFGWQAEGVLAGFYALSPPSPPRRSTPTQFCNLEPTRRRESGGGPTRDAATLW